MGAAIQDNHAHASVSGLDALDHAFAAAEAAAAVAVAARAAGCDTTGAEAAFGGSVAASAVAARAVCRAAIAVADATDADGPVVTGAECSRNRPAREPRPARCNAAAGRRSSRLRLRLR